MGHIVKENKISDMVNHPKHYADGNHEVIDVMVEYFGEQWTKIFCIMNAFKYLSRCKKKHKFPDEDINKAKWYLDKCTELSSFKNISESNSAIRVDDDPDWLKL